MRPASRCRFCLSPFKPPARYPDLDYCESCFYAGRLHAETHAAMIERLRAIRLVESVAVEHTGGGCFGLAVRFLSSTMVVFGTVAVRDGDGWTADGTMPEPGEPWALGVYESEEALLEGKDDFLAPLGADGVVLMVQGFSNLLASERAERTS
jgi:hypothetical protein